MTSPPGASQPGNGPSGAAQKLRKVQNLLAASFEELAVPPARTLMPEPTCLMLRDGAFVVKTPAEETSFATAEDAVEHLRTLAPLALDIVFDGRSCLDMTFKLPNVPLHELRAMVETEITFRSPFDAEKSVSFWEGREDADGAWAIRAAVALKAPLTPILQAITAKELKVSTVRRTLAEGGFAARPGWINTGRAGIRSGILGTFARIPSPWRAPLAGMAVFAASFIALTLSQAIEHSAAEAKVESLRTEIAQVARARAAANDFAGTQADSTRRATLVAELTALLPDGTWLEQMSVEGAEITITGYGPSAAEVTRLLSSEAGLADVRYGSPVTRDNSQNLERFRILANLPGGQT